MPGESEQKVKPKRMCIVRDRESSNFYYGGACYGSELSRAIYAEDKIPKESINNPEDEIIFIDSKEGLELLVGEIERLGHFIDIQKPRLADAEGRLEMLKGFGIVDEYIRRYKKVENPLTGVDANMKRQIIEDIVNGK